jgi:hypothetical protein
VVLASICEKDERKGGGDQWKNSNNLSQIDQRTLSTMSVCARKNVVK